MTYPLLGRFCWFDLMTDDLAAGIAFYCDVVGYTPQRWAEADYTMFSVGEQAVGGANALDDEAKGNGARPQWLGYIGHPDVDALAAQVRSLGGVVRAEPYDLPSVGRAAIFQDPHGAAFAGFTPTAPERIDVTSQGLGHIAWRELSGDDLEESWAFYTALFGWVSTSPDLDTGPGGGYRLYRAPGMETDLGGMSRRMPPQRRAAWTYYLTVDDLEAALERLEAAGGRLLHGPMVVPGGDRVAQCADPQGAAFALHCYAI